MTSGLRTLTLALIAGASAAAGAAPPGPAVAGDADVVRVTVTTTHAADLLQTVGGEHVRVDALMGPGVDPHLYRAGQGDVRLLVDADLVVHHGLGLEGRLGELLQAGGLERVHALTDALPAEGLIATSGGQVDPHVWFDPELWVSVVEPVVAELTELAPQHAQNFAVGGREYVKAVRAAHEEATAVLAEIPDHARLMVTSHDAFGYFGRAYDLEVRGLQGLSTEDEAGVGDIRGLVDLLVERRVPAVFAEASVSPAGLEAVRESAGARGWELDVPDHPLYSDTLGEPGTPEGTYAGALLANARLVAQALR